MPISVTACLRAGKRFVASSENMLQNQRMGPIDDLRARVSASTQSAVAETLGVSRQFIAQILAGEKTMSEQLANRLGYDKIVRYRKRNGE